MESESLDRVNNIAPPAFIYVGGLVIGLLVHWLYPVQVLPTPFAVGISVLFFVVSGPLAIAAVRAFSRAKTTYFLVSQPPKLSRTAHTVLAAIRAMFR